MCFGLLAFGAYGKLVSNVAIDTAAAATDTVDHVATDRIRLAGTSTSTILIEPVNPPGSPGRPRSTPVFHLVHRTDRAQPAPLLIRALVPGPVVIVTPLDRLARSSRDPLNVLAAVGERKVIATSALTIPAPRRRPRA